MKEYDWARILPYGDMIIFSSVRLLCHQINGHIKKDKLVYFCNEDIVENTHFDCFGAQKCLKCVEKLMLYIRVGII